MRWGVRIAVFVLLLVAGAAVIGLLARLSSNESVPLPQQVAAPAPPLPPPPVGSQWRYTSPRSPYASVAGEEACARSRSDVDIGGGAKSAVTLCLRRGGGYPYLGSIMLLDEHGRISCADCAVQVRFDDGGAQSFDGTAASTDGTAYALFIRDAPRLAAELRRASTATLAVSLHGAGEQTVTFDVAGLKWNG